MSGHAYNVSCPGKLAGVCAYTHLPAWSQHGNPHEATDAECAKIRDNLKHDRIIEKRTWSQLYQDMVVASLFSSAITPRSSVYVDLAANAAVHDSNTYLFDRCLGWRGLCVEPNPKYESQHRQKRSSRFARACVSSL